MKYNIGDCLTLEYPEVSPRYAPIVFLKVIGVKNKTELEYIFYNVLGKHELSYSVQNFDKIYYYRLATPTEVTLYFN